MYSSRRYLRKRKLWSLSVRSVIFVAIGVFLITLTAVLASNLLQQPGRTVPGSGNPLNVTYTVKAPVMQSEWLVLKAPQKVTAVWLSNNATPPVKNLALPRFQSLQSLNQTYIGMLYFNISGWYGMSYSGCRSLWINMTASPPTAYCYQGNSYLGDYNGPWPIYDQSGVAYNSKANYGWYYDSVTQVLWIHYTTFQSNYANLTIQEG